MDGAGHPDRMMRARHAWLRLPSMWLWFGIGGFLLYAVLLLTCGIRSGQRGHPVFFIVPDGTEGALAIRHESLVLARGERSPSGAARRRISSRRRYGG